MPISAQLLWKRPHGLDMMRSWNLEHMFVYMIYPGLITVALRSATPSLICPLLSARDMQGTPYDHQSSPNHSALSSHDKLPKIYGVSSRCNPIKQVSDFPPSTSTNRLLLSTARIKRSRGANDNRHKSVDQSGTPRLLRLYTTPCNRLPSSSAAGGLEEKGGVEDSEA